MQNETRIRKNQGDIKNDNDELIVKNYPKNKQPIKYQPKGKPPNCPSCKRNNWLEFDKSYYCQNCEHIINKQKHQIDKKVRRPDHYISTRLPYADKRMREIHYSMGNTTYDSTEDMINKLKQLKGKTKLNFLKKISNYYDEMNNRRQSDNFQFEEDPFVKNAQSVSKIFHEVVLLMKFLQTKPQLKNMIINFFDLYCTVIRNRDVKEILDDKYENDSINFKGIVPNRYIGRKNDNLMLT